MIKKPLKELSLIEYGKSPNSIRVELSEIPIYGTGGIVGKSSKPLFRGPLIVVGRKGTLGKPFYSSKDCWIIDTAYAIIPFKDIEPKWLFYNLSNYNLESLNEATGVPSISRDYLYKVSFVTPSYPEQQKIAEVLTTIDNVIEKTEQLIEKLKSIKKGLIRDLFTRGVTPDGKLRPSLEDAPELYRESELGLIPKEWEVVELKEFISKIIDNRGKTPPIDSNGEYELIETVSLNQNLTNPDYSLISKKINETTFNNWFRGHPQSGNILISTVGEYAGTVSIMGITRGTIAQNIVGFQINNSNSEKYLFYWFRSDFFEIQSLRIKMNAAQPSIKVPHILKFIVCKPSLDEQYRIEKMISSVYDRLLIENKYLNKLHNLKKGLMDDLLTGKVRVTELLKDEI